MRENIVDIIDEYRRLGIDQQLDYAKFYLYSIITHSTAIEGSTVSEVENRLLFDEGIGAQKPLVEQLMNLDLKAAYEQGLIYARQHTDYSVEMLCGLSALVMKNTGTEYSAMAGNFSAAKGELRLLNVSAGVGGRSYLSYQKVPSRTEAFCLWLNEERKHTDPKDIEKVYDLSFEAHYRLVEIHPWADGNGRMSRLVMNMIQYEFGAVPSIVKKENRKQYITSLERSEEENRPDKFKTFMLDHHCKNLTKQIAEYKKSTEKDDPINDPINAKPSILDLIKLHPDYNYSKFADEIGVSEATIKRRLGQLRKEGKIVRIGANKNGHWEVIPQK